MKVIFLMLALINLISCDNKQNTAQENVKPKVHEEKQSDIVIKEPETIIVADKNKPIKLNYTEKLNLKSDGYYDYPKAPENCKNLNSYSEKYKVGTYHSNGFDAGGYGDGLGESLLLSKISFEDAFEISKACCNKMFNHKIYTNTSFDDFKKNNYSLKTTKLAEEGFDYKFDMTITEKNEQKNLYCMVSFLF